MPDKTTHNAQKASSDEKCVPGRLKTSYAASQDPATSAPVRRTAYGQTPQEAAARLCDSLKEKPHTT